MKRHFDESTKNGQVAGHVLIKHSLAFTPGSFISSIAKEENFSIRRIGIPERSGDLAAILTHLRQSNILLIEDIHRLSDMVSVMLIDTMASFALHIEVGTGYGRKEVALSLPQFTVIGATSRPLLLSHALNQSFQKQICIDDGC